MSNGLLFLEDAEGRVLDFGDPYSTGTQPSELLPSPAGVFERALAESFQRNLPVPVQQVLDPLRTPSRFLPFLAAHRSADLWFEDWPEARKRKMAAEAIKLARLKGTRAGLAAFLEYVDAEIIDKISHPRRFVVGFSAVAVDPIGHRPFTAHILVKTPMRKQKLSFVIGHSALGSRFMIRPDPKPVERVLAAVRVAKAPETQVTVNFSHRRPLTIDDGFDLDAGVMLGAYIDRKKL